MIFFDVTEFASILGRDDKLNFACLDVGMAKTGVALGRFPSIFATPMTVFKGNNTGNIIQFLSQNQIDYLVVGICFEYNSHQTTYMTDYILKFCHKLDQLTQKILKGIILYDENHSSNEVWASLASKGMKTGKKLKANYDASVAAFLLQNFLNDLKIIKNI